MMDPAVWIGAAEWKMAATYLNISILVFSPEKYKSTSLSSFRVDSYPANSRKPALVVKDCNGHFQVKTFYRGICSF